jgi:hypothetical protein
MPFLEQAPEPLDRVRVDIPAHVDLRAVVDAVMVVTLSLELVVGLEFVRVHRGVGPNVRGD